MASMSMTFRVRSTLLSVPGNGLARAEHVRERDAVFVHADAGDVAHEGAAFAVHQLKGVGKAHDSFPLYQPEGLLQPVVAVAEVVDRLGDELRCLWLALVLQRVGDAVELLGVAAVVVEHIAHERESLFGRELGRVAVLVVMAGDVLVLRARGCAARSSPRGRVRPRAGPCVL